MARLREWAASVCYLGEFPFASGSVGSLGAVALYLWGSVFLRGEVLSGAAALAAGVLALIGIRIGRWAQEFYRQRDPREFVLDEVAGQFLALVAVTPLVLGVAPWKIAIAAFLFFRFFDIVKPFPAGRAERLRGGPGIVLDDIVAGAYAALCVHVWFHFVVGP
jgi:phosphatidylglycerophosphatase A